MIGKWEKVHYGDYPFLAKCSRCGHEIDTHYEGKHPNFCSNCGLPMNEEAARRLKTDLSEWIPIRFRRADDDEYKEFIERHDAIPREECKVCDCQMPDDGQEVLISTRGGHVYEDVFCADPDYYGFEDSDLDDVIAWMPKPEAYKKEDK